MAYTGGLDQIEFYPDLLLRSGSAKREKSICILENNPNHRAFLYYRIAEVEELLPGDSEVCKVVINFWGFKMVSDGRPIGYAEILGQCIQSLSPKPDMVIFSFLAKHDVDLVCGLLRYLEEWTENGSVVLFSNSAKNKDFGVPCFSRYDSEGIKYIADWLAGPDETVM